MLLPIRPRYDTYRGAKPNLQRQAAEFNRLANKIADHFNVLIANKPDEMQQYIYGYVAIDLGVDVEMVRRVILGGGYNGITLRVTEEDRRALQSYKRPAATGQS